MAKFEIPKAFGKINVVKLDGSFATEYYPDPDKFFAALVRANISNARGTVKVLGEMDMETMTAWIVVTDKKDVDE